MKLILLACVCLLAGCDSIAKKTGIDPIDLLVITTDATRRAQTAYEATKTDLAAAKINYASRRPATAPKQPLDVQP